MNKYCVEFGFGENFFSVTEWQTYDDLMEVDAKAAEDAAKDAACTDGLEDALFRVYGLVLNDFGELEKYGEPEYFEF